MRRLRLLTCCVVFLLLLAGCASSPATMEAIDDGYAEQLMEQGDFRGAAVEYQRLAKENRKLRDSLLLSAAEALREEGDFDAIAPITARIRGDRLSRRERLRLDLLLAEAALAAGDAQRAYDLAALPADETPNAAFAARAYEIRARALQGLGRPLDAVRERLAMAGTLEAGERARNDDDILNQLAEVDPAILQKALVELPRDDAMRPWIERALRLKGAMPARVFERPTRQVGTMLPADGAASAWKREGYASTPRVALLLPLTGSLATAGKAIRDGFFASYFSNEQGAENQGVERPQVRVFDTGDSVDGALGAYEKAVADGSARVVGPLAREQVQALFERVELTVPVLALNFPDTGSPPPAKSMLFGLLPDEEGAYAAEHAIERGITRAAIFAGTEEWSERAALAFRAQFENRGGTIVGEARVPTGAVDYSSAIGQAMAAPADVAFIAVRPQQGRLLVPQIKSRAPGLALLATSHVYAGSPSRSLDRDLNDVEFCDSPWVHGAAVGLPSREALGRTLPNAGAASRLFAFGMDAYRLLPYLDWLTANPDAYLSGATGQLSIDSFGRVRRIPTWMRFVDGVPQSAENLVPQPGASP